MKSPKQVNIFLHAITAVGDLLGSFRSLMWLGYDMTLFTKSIHVLKTFNQFFKLCFHTTQNHYQIMENDVLLPPKVLNMKTLDRSAFVKFVNVPCLLLEDISLDDIRRILKPYLLKLPKLKSILCDDKIKVLLNPNRILKWSDFDECTISHLANLRVFESNWSQEKVTLTYDNWNADDLLRAVLPSEKGIARGFSKVGHIIHLNLKDHLIEHKNIIGEILMDKIPNTKTVVNKVHQIDNTYRNFEIEVICGENNMIADVKENNCRYQFDFAKVYWNPRLSTEHQRIIDGVKPGDILFDVFCGVGPFAIPCAKKKAKVYANDLNPESFKWLNHNCKINKVDLQFIETFNEDASEFIKVHVRDILLNQHSEEFKNKVHVVMNLPALALDFIKEFKHLFTAAEMKEKCIAQFLPLIHVYFFVTCNDLESASQEFTARTGIQYNCEIMSYQFVRNVAQKKDMVKMSFTPPLNFICNDSGHSENEQMEPPLKRIALHDHEKSSNSNCD